MTPLDAAGLVQAIARDRDREAFARLFNHFAPRVKGYIRRAGADDATAEEVAQEAMLTLWRKAALFDPRQASVSTWVFTIARNLRIDRLRRERRPQVDPDDPALVGEAYEERDPHEVAQREERLRASLSSLPPDQAQVVRMAFFEAKAHSEIAAELGLPLGTVKSRLRLAFGRLRGALEGRV